MSVTTTVIGPNSKKVTYTSGETTANILAALSDAVTALGWTVWSSNAGLSDARAFRAPNELDSQSAASYKYVVLDLNTAGILMLKVYETFVQDGTTGTNPAYYSDQSSTLYHQRIDLTNGGDIYVFCNSRWMILLSYSTALGYGNSNNNGWTGCIEYTRDNAEDLVSATGTPYVFIMGNSFAMQAPKITFPKIKTFAGFSTGLNSAYFSAISTEMGIGLHDTFNSSYIYKVPSSYKNCWNNKHIIYTPNVFFKTEGGGMVAGRLMGLKFITSSAGNQFDNIIVRVDSMYMSSTTGTLCDHAILCKNTSIDRVIIPK